MEAHTAENNNDKCHHFSTTHIKLNTENLQPMLPFLLCSPCLFSSYRDGNLGHTV